MSTEGLETMVAQECLAKGHDTSAHEQGEARSRRRKDALRWWRRACSDRSRCEADPQVGVRKAERVRDKEVSDGDNGNRSHHQCASRAQLGADAKSAKEDNREQAVGNNKQPRWPTLVGLRALHELEEMEDAVDQYRACLAEVRSGLWPSEEDQHCKYVDDKAQCK